MALYLFLVKGRRGARYFFEVLIKGLHVSEADALGDLGSRIPTEQRDCLVDADNVQIGRKPRVYVLLEKRRKIVAVISEFGSKALLREPLCIVLLNVAEDLGRNVRPLVAIRLGKRSILQKLCKRIGIDPLFQQRIGAICKL